MAARTGASGERPGCFLSPRDPTIKRRRFARFGHLDSDSRCGARDPAEPRGPGAPRSARRQNPGDGDRALALCQLRPRRLVRVAIPRLRLVRIRATAGAGRGGSRKGGAGSDYNGGIRGRAGAGTRKGACWRGLFRQGTGQARGPRAASTDSTPAASAAPRRCNRRRRRPGARTVAYGVAPSPLRRRRLMPFMQGRSLIACRRAGCSRLRRGAGLPYPAPRRASSPPPARGRSPSSLGSASARRASESRR